MNEGWQCPICKTVWAPSVVRCNTCAPITVNVPSVWTKPACTCGTTAFCQLHGIRYTSVMVSAPTGGVLWLKHAGEP